MSKAKSGKHEFEIATSDPQDVATGLIAGREFYARPFTMREVSALMGGGGGLTTVEKEADVLAPMLARRAVDGEAVTADWLIDTLTRQQFQQVIEWFVGLGAARNEGEQGKA